VESRALAPMLWLLASESKDGVINMTIEALVFRLRVDALYLVNSLEPLITKGFFLDASAMLASRLQHATPETETETETETEKSPFQESEYKGGTRTLEPKVGAVLRLEIPGNIPAARVHGFDIPEVM